MKILKNIMKQVDDCPTIKFDGDSWTYRWNMKEYARDPYRDELFRFTEYIEWN